MGLIGEYGKDVLNARTADELAEALSPGLVKLATPDTGHVGRGAGRVFAISTLGSIVGTLVTAFYLIAWMGTNSATMVMALPLFAAALLCVLPPARSSQS